MENNNIVPNDVLEEILSRVSVKQLLQLRCVNKSWCAIIDDDSFVKKHYKFRYALCMVEEGDIPLFGNSTPPRPWKQPVQFSLLRKQQGEDVFLNMTPDLHRDIATHFTNDEGIFKSMLCCGVVNGIILLQWDKRYWGLWNPATREFFVVPCSPYLLETINHRHQSVLVLGFGFDPMSNDFKVLAIIESSQNDTEVIRVYEIYSLSTNSWKRLENPSVCCSIKDSHIDAYSNGVYYWAAHEENSIWILAFNFSTESFKNFDFPEAAVALTDMDEVYWKVGLYMERVAVIVNHRHAIRDPYGIHFVDIWVVAESDDDDAYDLGTTLSWQHLSTVGPIHAFDCIGVITFRMDGDMLYEIAVETEAMVETNVYSPSTNTFKKMELLFYTCFRYVESLFSLSKRLVPN